MDKEKEIELEVKQESPESQQDDTADTTLTATEEVENASDQTQPEVEAESESEVKEEESLPEADSTATEETETENVAENGEATQESEKMITQSQVNKLMGQAREEGRKAALKDLYGRYGVTCDDELNGIFGKGQIYDELNDEYSSQGNSMRMVMAENALLKSHITPDRWEDVKLILTGKGLDVSQENIESMIASHPEWRESGLATTENATQQPEMHMEEGNKKSPTVIKKLGADVETTNNSDDSESKERLDHLFNM